MIAYIGPQMGLPFATFGAALLALAVPFLLLLLAPFRALLRRIRKGGKPALALVLAVLAAGIGGGGYLLQRSSSSGTSARVIVLGLDGLDPNLLEQYMGQGLLPHFQQLKEQGSYRRLGTTNPAISPVAWSSFITGSNPGRHGMYDFLRRDPKTYLPDLALSEVHGNKLKTSRQGTAFWEVTSRHRIPTVVVRTPVTFPPDKVHGRMLSGLGVPDVRGTQGTFAFYTTDSIETGRAMGGQIFQVRYNSDTIHAAIVGPRKPGAREEVKIPLEIAVHKDNPHVTLQFQKESFDLQVGRWSDWKKMSFTMGPMAQVAGIARFYLEAVEPELKLYLSPIGFDPRAPAFPISHPKGYSAELAEEIGLYATLGQAEDTWSLNEGRVSDDTFLQQCDEVIREREAMLLYELNRFEKGLLVCCFDTPDRIQHMFWRYHDTEHPLYDPEQAKKYADLFPKLYQRMDEILGKVMRVVDDHTVLIVLSDHGFSNYRTSVHTNAWFVQEGFLALEPGTDRSENLEFFSGVDWSKSRVYAVGLAGIYLNLRGREREGIVAPEEVPALSEQLAQSLAKMKDPATGKPVVRRLYRKDEAYRGAALDRAPDFVIAFEPGYRSSWQTALGGIPPLFFEPNLKRWSGDHCVEPSLVPGVLLVNRPVSRTSPEIVDIAPTILVLFGLEIPESVDGAPLLSQSQTMEGVKG